MSHPEQVAFFREIATANEALIANANLLEVGSYDVNGSVRRIFADAASYVGVDLSPGPGVDRIGYGHDIGDPDGSYDITISGECFEHDPHWPETLTNMARLTRSGGITAFSCASSGRPEHGTVRSAPDASPGTQSRGLDYYRNLTRMDVEEAVDLRSLFVEYRFWNIRTSFDLYFVGIRAGQSADRETGRIPPNDAVRAIAELMPLSHRLLRWPLRLMSAGLPSDAYQPAAIRYWRMQERLQVHSSLARFRRTDVS